MFYSFFKECDPALGRLLLARYSGKNLRFPPVGDPLFVAANFEFFMRYYNSGGFREVLPNLSLVGE